MSKAKTKKSRKKKERARKQIVRTADPDAVQALRETNPEDDVVLEQGGDLPDLRWRPGWSHPILQPRPCKAVYADGKPRDY